MRSVLIHVVSCAAVIHNLRTISTKCHAVIHNLRTISTKCHAVIHNLRTISTKCHTSAVAAAAEKAISQLVGFYNESITI